MHQTVLLLGGNLEQVHENLIKASELIETELGDIVSRSAFYESLAWGFDSQDNFLNQVLILNTLLNPFELLSKAQNIEKQLGRITKSNHNVYESRIIDIDILFYENHIIDTIELKVPHPSLHKRRFTLTPLNEVLPNFIHPVIKQPIHVLLSELEDTSWCKQWIQ
jgi:2-amino-4-hydroxy-6-hydroxymethyldihydropteridine diphosphokinase